MTRTGETDTLKTATGATTDRAHETAEIGETDHGPRIGAIGIATTIIGAVGDAMTRDPGETTQEGLEGIGTEMHPTVTETAEVWKAAAPATVLFSRSLQDLGRNDDRRRSISPQALPTRPRKDAAKPPPPARSPPRQGKTSPEVDEVAVQDDGGDAMDEGQDDDLAAMQALMGFGDFGSTKGKYVAGNRAGGVRKEKKTEYRQYMNRQGGFNRPLSPGRQ